MNVVVLKFPFFDGDYRGVCVDDGGYNDLDVAL